MAGTRAASGRGKKTVWAVGPSGNGRKTLMQRTSLLMIALLGATWTFGCGDDSSGSEPLTEAGPEDSVGESTSSEPESTTVGTESDATTSVPESSTEDEPDSATGDEWSVASETDDGDPTLGDSQSDNSTSDNDAQAPNPTETSSDATTASETEGTESQTDDPGSVTETIDGGEPETDLDGGLDAAIDDANLIGAQGGTISNNSGLTLFIPANSINPPSVITFDAVVPSNTDGLVSEAIDFGPDGITFDPAATLTMPFDLGAAAGANVVIAWLDGSNWVPLTDCVTDSAQVTCPVSHFTTFGVITQATDGGTAEECPTVHCIDDLRTDCIPEGECHFEGALADQQFCWDNGVSYDFATNAGFPTTLTTITWHDAADQVCMVFETTTTTVLDGNTATSTSEVKWKDPQGTVVATEVVDTEAGTTTITCSGTNETVVYYNDSDCKGPDDSEGDACTEGSCP
jgi:hypothetical protein